MIKRFIEIVKDSMRDMFEFSVAFNAVVYVISTFIWIFFGIMEAFIFYNSTSTIGWICMLIFGIKSQVDNQKEEKEKKV